MLQNLCPSRYTKSQQDNFVWEPAAGINCRWLNDTLCLQYVLFTWYLMLMAIMSSKSVGTLIALTVERSIWHSDQVEEYVLTDKFAPHGISSQGKG